MSFAVPVKLTRAPWLKLDPLAGALIKTVGAVFATTLSVIWAVPVSPPLSVTEAVSVWVPAERVLVEEEPPFTIGPFRLQLQASAAVRSPCRVSFAVPGKRTRAPGVKLDWLAGALI